ncbi:hypothetical protein RHGRI_023626 [Rhododendron griersonianum]|uniref:Uncharacterized protein n=1 Tax=Rhododendron griersonianum TaxID=479676 RepID=A0AAV6JBF5_9ERIC|nr:hypothetical protein RHGRI_023626 [Rhododendron griersonianum]
MAKKAAWSVSSCKPGNGVTSLRDGNLDTYWHMMDQFPSLRSGKSPKNSENLKNPNSSSEVNVPHVFSPKAATGVIPVKLLDNLEEVSSPVVPIPAPADDPCSRSSKPKWVDVVAPFSYDSTSSSMNLSYFPPQLRDSKVVVCPPQDVVDQGSDLWTDCIVGYFLDKKVPFPIVKNIVMRIWEKFGIYDVRANDQGFFFFKFSKVDAYRSLMEMGPFTVDSPLPDVVEVEYANGSSAFVAAKYPWKPSRCSECRVFGHTEARHKVHVAEVGANVPPPVLSSPEQEVGLPSDESIDQAMVSPVEPVLYASESLGRVPFSTKPYRSPSVGILLAQGNTVVMTDGVASGLSVSGRGLVEMVPHSAIRSQGSPVNKASPVTQGLGMNRCSNTFSILETTLPDDTAFQEELLQQGGYLLVGEGSGNAVQAIEALDQADSPNAIGLVVTPPLRLLRRRAEAGVLRNIRRLFVPYRKNFDRVLFQFRSDGAQPHLVNIQFQKKVKLQLVVLYVDFKLDESYTPSKISIRAGDGFQNLKEIKSVELVKPTGWVYISLSGNDPQETFVNTFMLQIAVLSNHLNGRDTHVRQIKVYGPRLNPIPRQPFQFTSREFITYSTSLVGDDSMVYQELMSRSLNADQYLGNMFPAFRELQLAGTEFVGDTISIAPLQLVTSSSPEVNHSFSVGLNLKKRKADECCNDDEIGVEVRQGESAAIETINMETSTDNSKVSDVEKPDYIHVRARRGQATDSHSLAERARREKINKKMKCLQDLVPGCSKVTGKAGMLDEIINYVQSLQRQIEFLSMKLAALDPRLDFDMDRFSMEEFPAHVTSFPAAVAPPEMADLAYQFSQVQKGAAAYGIDTPINPMQLAPQRSTTSSSSLSIPKALYHGRTHIYVCAINRKNFDRVLFQFRSDGAQPHLVNIQFQKKVKLQLVVLYVDFKLDESYTPSKISIRAGDGFQNLKEIKSVELCKPTGWVYISLSGNDPRETFVNTFMLQIAVLSNHLNGRDTHVRQIKVYGPRLNPIPRQPFQFTSREFITYSTAKDFDTDSLRNGLPKAVSSLEWAISEGKGKLYMHCTAGLGRAPAVAIAYMFWFCDMDLNTAYDTLTSKRPCGPSKRAIRGATYDLAKNDPWKEPFESLPEHAFEGISGWERKLIQDRVRSFRGT